MLSDVIVKRENMCSSNERGSRSPSFFLLVLVFTVEEPSGSSESLSDDSDISFENATISGEWMIPQTNAENLLNPLAVCKTGMLLEL